jgi:hypothetical protein
VVTAALIIVGLSAAASLAIMGWMYQRAKGEAEMWHEQSKRLLTDLNAFTAAAKDERARLEEALRVAHAEAESARSRMASLLSGHPGLLSQYLDRVFKHAAEAGAGPLPSLPEGPAAPVPGSGGKRDR